MAVTQGRQRAIPTESPIERSKAGDFLHLGSQSTTISRWFTHSARKLPWRELTGPQRPWGVLVSEFMLQQTPVDRVLPVWQAWWERWPEPRLLAAEPPAEAVRAWGRLGYPRRALRLHAAAVAICADFGGAVPRSESDLLSLPGVGEYTAGAVRAFAYDEPAATLDTNVRRVIARHDWGQAGARSSGITSAERDHAAQSMPRRRGAAWMAALMELGATVCTARAPRCEACPVAKSCRWRALGYPEPESVTRRQPRYDGSDRQARGALLAVLRDAAGPVSGRELDLAWPEPGQRARALDSLVADGLVEPVGRSRWSLPRS